MSTSAVTTKKSSRLLWKTTVSAPAATVSLTGTWVTVCTPTTSATVRTRIRSTACRWPLGAAATPSVISGGQRRAELAAAHLAGRPERQCRGDPDLDGALVARQPFGAHPGELAGERVGEVAAHGDERDRDLAQPRMGRTDDRRGGDRRVVEEDPLHLLGVELLAAAVDDVVLAPGEVEEAGVVDPAEVAGGEPAAGVARRAQPLGTGGRELEVVGDHGVAAQAHRTQLPGGDGEAVGSGHLEVDADRQPDRPGPPRRRIERVGGDLPGDLGHPVGLEHGDAGVALEALEQGRGQRRRRRAGEADPLHDRP